MALVDDVQGGCLLSAGRTAEAAPLIERSLPILLKKWGPDGLYGHDAVQRKQRLDAARGSH
jgi:hypothetical protein